MTPQLKGKLDNIIEFEVSIKNLYRTLADLEIEGKIDTEDYQNAFSLLDYTCKRETCKIDDLSLSEENILEFKNYLTQDQDEFDVAYILDSQDHLENIRLNNVLTRLINNENGFTTEESLSDPVYGSELKEALADFQFKEFFESTLDFNMIYMLNHDLESITDEELRRFFIYLKYFNIYINPTYERDYISHKGHLSNLIDLHLFRYQVPGYTDEEFECYTRNALTMQIMGDIEFLLEYKDETFLKHPYNLDIKRMITINKARLVSLADISFIDLIKATYDLIIADDDETEEKDTKLVRAEIARMFKESYEILIGIKRDKELKLKAKESDKNGKQH